MSKKVLIERNGSGGVVSTVAIGDGLEFHGEWMSHGYVTVKVNSATEIAFAVGDFVEFAGRKFYLWDEESVKKQARSGSYGEAYVYDNIKLHEGTVALEQVSMHDVVLEDNGQTYSSLSRFSFFGATVDDLADRIQANLVRQSTAIGGDTLRFRLFTPDKTRTTGRMSNMGNVGTAWESYYTGNEATGKKDVAVSIQNETLWGALGHAYNDFELPYYVASSNENDVDYIDIVIGGKAVEVSNSAFVYGKGHGLYEIERSADSDQRIVTKLFAYGSTENLPTNYYGNLYKVAYADCLQSDTFVIDGGNYYFVDAVTGSGILWSSVKDALGVRTDVRPSPFSIGGHTPVGKSVTVRCNNTNYTASIWVYETGGEQYLSFKTETQAPVVSDTKFYILDGVDLLKWPNLKIETASGYPGGMAIMNLMLPGFPKVSLADWVDALPAGNATKVRATNYVLSDEETDPWIQSANAAVYGIREGEVYFDGTDDGENIRPSIENTDFGTVASVTGITDDGWVDKTEGFVIKVLAANGGGDFWQAVWDAPHDDEVPLTMTSGYHNGREFKLTKVVVGTTYVELSVDRIQDESGRWVPNTEQPIVGRDLPTPQHDTFVVTGIQLPKEYIDAASEKLLMAAFDELDKIDHGLRTYQPRLDEIYMAHEQATAEIESRASLHDTLRAGMVLKWQWEDYGTQGATVISSTIDVLTIKEDGNNGVPTYDVVLRDEKEKSLTEKIATVVSKTTGIGGGTAVRSDGGNADTAKKADRLSGDDEVTAWGQTYWENGKPKDVSGSLEGVDDITMTGDLNLGNTGMGIDQSGDAVLNSVTIAETTTTTSGGTETTTEDKAMLTEDGLVVTEKVDNTVTKSTVVDENGMTIGTYAEGLFGTGGVFKMIDGKSYLEADKLYVRMKAYFDTLEIRRYIHSGGNRVASAAGCKVSRVERLMEIETLEGKTLVIITDPTKFNLTERFRCYFRSTDGDNTITNDFIVGDLAYCHSTNVTQGSLNQKYYWRLVIDKGTTNNDEHYIDLAAKEDEYTITIEGETYTFDGCMENHPDVPTEGDDVVQLGNIVDTDRQGAIIEAVSGSSQKPTYRIYQGIDHYEFPAPKVDMGYDISTGRAYLNVFGDFYVGDANKTTYVQYEQAHDNGAGTNPRYTPLLSIKANIEASSPLVGAGIDPNTTLVGYINNNLQDITDAYGYLAVNLARKNPTLISGGLILTSLIGLRNSNNVLTAGINGENEASNIALWLGGPMADWDSLTPEQQAVANRANYAKSLFRFDGSGYLAGGDISWTDEGDTTVKGTIKADNLYHSVCYYFKGDYGRGIYVSNALYYFKESEVEEEDTRDFTQFHNGDYYTIEQIKAVDSSFHGGEPFFIPTTGKADVVMCMPDANNWESSDYVTLPDPEDFQGKVVEVSAFSYGSEASELVVSCVCTEFRHPRMVALVGADVSSNDPKIKIGTNLTGSMTIATGGVARFLSVEAEITTNTKAWLWTLLANQTGGDIYVNGGGGSGSGTVTSVGMTVPAGFSVSPQTITGADTFDIIFARGNLGNGLVLATPSSGNNAPSWRALVAADIPNLDWSKITSGTPTTLSGYGITDAKIENGEISLGSNSITPLTSQSLNGYATEQYVQNSCMMTSERGNYVKIDGDTMTGALTVNGNITIGSGNAYKVTVQGNGVDILKYDANGWTGVVNTNHWFVGTEAPGVLKSGAPLLRYWRTDNGSTVHVATILDSTNWGSYVTGFMTLGTAQTITGNKTFNNTVDIAGHNVIRFDGANSSWILENVDYCLEIHGYNGIELNETAITGELTLKHPDDNLSSLIYHGDDGMLHLKNDTNYVVIDIDEEEDGETVTNYYRVLTEASLAGYLPLTGGTMTGGIAMGSNYISFGNASVGGAINVNSTLGGMFIGGTELGLYSDGFIELGASLIKLNGSVDLGYGRYLNFKDSNNNTVGAIRGTTGTLNIGGESVSITADNPLTFNGSNVITEATMPFRYLRNSASDNDETLGSITRLIMPLTVTQIAGTTMKQAQLNLSGYAQTTALDGYLPLTIPSTGKTLNLPGIGLLTVKNTASDYPLIRFEGKTAGGIGFLGIGKTGTTVEPYFVTADSNGGYTDGTSVWNRIWHAGNFKGIKITGFSDFVPLGSSSANYGWIDLTDLYTTVGNNINTAVSGKVSKTGDSMTGALSMAAGVNVNFGYCGITSNASASNGLNAGTVLSIMGNNVNVITDGVDSDFKVNGSIVATRPWVTTQLGSYLPLTGGSGKPLTGDLYFNASALGLYMKDSAGNSYAAIRDNATNLWIGATATSSYHHRGSTYISAGHNGTNGNATIYVCVPNAANNGGTNYGVWHTGNLTPSNYLPLTGGRLTGNLVMANSNNTTNDDSVKIAFYTNQNYTNISPYIQAINEAAYGRKRLSVFQKNVADWDTPQVEVFTIKPDGNVGIGTTTPAAKLDVNGNVRISGTLTGVTNIDGLMIFDSTNNKVTVGTLDVTTLGMTSISVGDTGYKMFITSDDSGVSFSGTSDGYSFDDDIYAVGGHFTGGMTVGNSSNALNLTVNGRARFGNYVGIGTEPNTSYALDIDGSVRASSFVNGSDIRMKDIVSYMLPSVHEIASAPIIEFTWKKGDRSKNIGSIAQYWEKVFPQAVHEGGDGMLSMEYGTIALASAITAARHSLDNERRIAELELRVAELESLLESYEINNNNINN